MDKLIGQRVVQGEEKVAEGTVVAVAHDEGRKWQLLLVTDDGRLVGVPSLGARLKPKPAPSATHM